MSEEALKRLYEKSKKEIVKGGDWRLRISNSTDYKILETQYEGLSELLNRAEAYMQGTNVLKHFIEQEIKNLIRNRERLNYKMKTPFFDEIDVEVQRIKRMLTYYSIPDYDGNAEYVYELIKNMLMIEANKNEYKFRS